MSKQAGIIAIWVTTHQEDGVECYRDSNGNDLALKLKGGTVCDLREKPPFIPLSPYPYCGAFNDTGHKAQKHIDPSLGE